MLRSMNRKFASKFAPLRGLCLRLPAIGLVAIGMAAMFAGRCLAAEPTPGAKSAPGPAAPSSTASGAAPAPRPDEAERRKVIDSPAWREMQHNLMEWLSVQKVYTPSRLRKVKAELNAKVAKMTPEELVEFMNDMNVKLQILLGKEAEEARLWVERRLAVQANLTPEQLKQMRPDVLNMTSAQLEQRLMEWKEQRQQTIATQQAFDKGRQTQVKNIEAMEKDEEHERDEALNRAYYDLGNGSPYGSYYGGGRSNNNAGNYYGMYGGGGYAGGGYGGYGGYRW
jgi:hypothetical protein